jgi:translin
LIAGEDLPKPKTLDVSNAAYLDGLGESVGELRRYILDSLRRDDFSRCEELLTIMDEIYGILITMDFPELLAHGLRRTTDAVRGIIERTRGDLTVSLRQKNLEKKLNDLG